MDDRLRDAEAALRRVRELTRLFPSLDADANWRERFMAAHAATQVYFQRYEPDRCPICDGGWGEPQDATAQSGPMEGDWIVRPCTNCNAGVVGPADGGDGLSNIIAALDAAGLDPKPNDDDRGPPE